MKQEGLKNRRIRLRPIDFSDEVLGGPRSILLAKVGPQNELDHLGQEFFDAIELADDEALIGRPKDRTCERLLERRGKLVPLRAELASGAQQRDEGFAGPRVAGEDRRTGGRALDHAGPSDNRVCEIISMVPRATAT